MPAAYLTTVEAEQLTKINRRRLATLAQEGTLHPIQRGRGGHYLWSSAELLAIGRPPTVVIDYERLADMVAERTAGKVASKIADALILLLTK